MTVKVVNVPLVVQPENRDTVGTKDAKLVNAFINKYADGTVAVQKRSGFKLLHQICPDINANCVGRYVSRSAYELAVYLDYGVSLTLYRRQNGYAINSYTLILDNSAKVYFNETQGGSPVVFIDTGNDVYSLTDSGTFTHVGNWAALTGFGTLGPSVYLNGSVYVLAVGGRVYNSALDDITTWPALNYITVNNDSDGYVAIYKQLTYILVFKKYSIEVFYDSGTGAGSPLARNDSAKISSYGVELRDYIQKIGDTLIWVALSRNGNLVVARLDELYLRIVSTDSINLLLGSASSTTSFTWDGHSCFCVNVTGKSLVYDLDKDCWYEWEAPDGGALPYEYPITESGNNTMLSGGYSYSLSNTQYGDSDSGGTVNTFSVRIITPNYTGGAQVKKYCSRLTLLTDQVLNSSVSVTFSDDDYQTWSDTRTLDLSLDVNSTPSWGTFRRRAFTIEHTANTPFRATGLELNLDMGTT